MAKTAVINVRTDIETKTAIEELYSAFGISVSDAINIFFKKSLMDNGLPFDMQIPRYNIDTLAAIEEVKVMEKSPHLYKGFNSIDKLFEELNDDGD